MLNKMKSMETASVAKERLQSLFVTDKLQCTNAGMKEMETDMIRNVKKYFSVVPSKTRIRLVQKEEIDEYLLIFEAVIKK